MDSPLAHRTTSAGEAALVGAVNVTLSRCFGTPALSAHVNDSSAIAAWPSGSRLSPSTPSSLRK
jgi:hypothetical protein